MSLCLAFSTTDLIFIDAVYKATKISANGDVKTNGKGTVEDEVEDDDDIAAGPEVPPDEEAQLSDDDEGRFFGGGLTKDTADVMDFIDEQDNDETVGLSAGSISLETRLTGYLQEPEKVDTAWLRKLALNFEKRISKNTELRAKFEDKPEKYVQRLYTFW